MWWANPGWCGYPNHAALVAAGASTPIAFVAGVETASTNGTSVTSAAIDSTGANLLVVAVADYGGAAQGTVTDSKSNTWAPHLTVQNNGTERVCLFYSTPSSVGSGHTVSYTATQPSIGFAAFSNTNASPFDSEVGTTGTSFAPAGGSITPSASGGLIICAMCALSDNTSTVDSSFSLIGSAIGVTANNFGLGMAYLIETTAVAKNPTWTVSSGNPWAATNAAFKN